MAILDSTVPWSAAADIATVVTSVVAVISIILVIYGWRKTLAIQKQSNVHNNRIQAMLAYQKDLLIRYESMLVAISPFIFSLQTFRRIIAASHGRESAEMLRSFFGRLHGDIKNMEKGLLPYTLMLSANVLFDEVTVLEHRNDMESIAGKIRTILGEPLEPALENATVESFDRLAALEESYVAAAFDFMRYVGLQTRQVVNNGAKNEPSL